MQALEVVTIIRNWAIDQCKGLAILDDTPRFNLLVAQIDGMSECVARGGDHMEDHLREIVFHEMPVQLDGHPSAIKALQAGFDDLFSKLQPSAKAASQPAIVTIASKVSTEHELDVKQAVSKPGNLVKDVTAEHSEEPTKSA